MRETLSKIIKEEQDLTVPVQSHSAKVQISRAAGRSWDAAAAEVAVETRLANSLAGIAKVLGVEVCQAAQPGIEGKLFVEADSLFPHLGLDRALERRLDSINVTPEHMAPYFTRWLVYNAAAIAVKEPDASLPEMWGLINERRIEEDIDFPTQMHIDELSTLTATVMAAQYTVADFHAPVPRVIS